jgi:plastocyanin
MVGLTDFDRTKGWLMARVGRAGGRLLALLGIVGGLAIMAPPLSAEAATVTVRITSTLTPKSADITTGATVLWRNDDSRRHRVRSTSGPVEFDSGDIEPGDTYSFRFRTAGSYKYNDHREQDDSAYWGSVRVSSGGTTPTPPPPSPTPGGGGGAPASAAVAIVNRAFSPRTVTIAAGGTVRWTNSDGDSHTVTARGGGFDSGILRSGGTFSRRFPAAGSFAYICLIHSDMTGTVTVTGTAPPGGGDRGGGTTNPPPTTPRRPPATRPKPASGGRALTVRMTDFAFGPRRLSARVGDTVTFSNAGPSMHTATAASGAFSSGFLPAGGRFSTLLRRAGMLSYVCQLHPQMRGTLVVGPARPGTTLPPGSSSGRGRAGPPLSGPATTAAGPPASAAAVPGAVALNDEAAGLQRTSAADTGRSPLAYVGLGLVWVALAYVGLVHLLHRRPTGGAVRAGAG